MKPATSLGLNRCPEQSSGSGTLKFRPLWWRAACASLAALALGATAARAGVNWIDQDLSGPLNAPGSAVTNGDGSITIQGGGDDIWNATTHCNYYYAWAAGTNWTITVNVENFYGPNTWSKCELMVDKADTVAGPQGSDAFVSIMETQPTTAPPNGVSGVNDFGIDQFRTDAGGSADWHQAGNTPAPSAGANWMRLVRTGTAFQFWYSYDGANWTNYTTLDTAVSQWNGQDNGTTFGPAKAFPNLVCVGVAVTAHNDAVGSYAVAQISNLTADFAGIAAPTVVNATVQVSNVTTSVGSEASFSFVTTNDSSPNVVRPSYQWYKNNNVISNATGNTLTFLAAASDNAAQIKCVATVPYPYNTTVPSVTSTIGTLTVNNNITIVTNGLKREFFAGVTSRVLVEGGDVGPATSINVRPNFDDPGGYGNNYIQRLSGFFIPPTTGFYVFFVASDDDSDLFLSTDRTAEHKSMVAQETGWSGTDQWLATDANGVAGGGGGNNWAQQRSDTFSPDGGITTPYMNGIPLSAGQLYYMEGVMHQGGGGDDFCVTYKLTTDIDPTNGQHSVLSITNGNIAFMSYPDTTPVWTLQPTNKTMTANAGGGLSAIANAGGEFGALYQWLSNNVPVPGATASTYFNASWPVSASGASYALKATGVMNGLSSTSSPAIVLVAAGVLEYSWVKVDWFFGGGRVALESGALGISTNQITSPKFEADTTGHTANNYANRLSCLFYPPQSGNYVFFCASDDTSDLFVSTDATPGNKRMVAQETGWSNPWQWVTGGGGGGNNWAQQRSDQFSPDNGFSQPFAAGIPMTAGQPYYIELNHEDTGGGESAGVTYKLTTDPDPVNGSASTLTGSRVAITVPHSFYCGFTQQPTNITAPTYGQALFTVGADTDSQVAVGGTGNDSALFNNRVAYQWYVNGNPVTGATSPTFLIQPVSPADNGKQIYCAIRSLGFQDGSGNDIWTNSATATLTVQGGQVLESGFALHRYYGANNPGIGSMEAGTAGNPDWVMSTPALAADINGTEVADNFCDDLIGFFIPPTSGNYVFFVNSDDASDLFLSTDASFGNGRLIAQETGSAGVLAWGTTSGTAGQERSDTFVSPTLGGTPFASGIPLSAGQKYAMHLFLHLGGGGTESSVYAKLIGDPDPATGTLPNITGSSLASYFPACTYVNITNQPQSVSQAAYTSASFNVTGGTDSKTAVGPDTDWRPYMNNFLVFQWYKNNVAIPGATLPTYTISSLLPTDNNDHIYCTVRALGYADGSGNPLWKTSTVANVAVSWTAPKVAYSAYYDNSNYVNFGYSPTNYIIVAFSAPMDPALLGSSSMYTLGGGLFIQSVLVNTNDYRSVALAVLGNITLPITVTVNSALTSMGGGLALGTNNAVALASVPLTDVDIGGAGSDPAIPGMMFVEGPGAYTILAEGSDIWNTSDGFNFAYEMKTNDFDVVVQVTGEKYTSTWSKAGLMVRETLAAGSRDWNIITSPTQGINDIEANDRVATGGATAGWEASGYSRPAPTYPNTWLRLKRVGGIVSAYNSVDGGNWNLQAIQNPATNGDMTVLPSVVYVGLCTTAHNNDPSGTDPSMLQYVNTADYVNYNSSYVYVPGAPVLTASVVAGQLHITWTPVVGHLVFSPALTGLNVNWQSVSGGTGGSVTVPIGSGDQFFKVSNP